ncbi:polyferredoxin [Methanohalophilus levihalophilus]|uniref:4Fe-4S binding protein n=1 Tax=Methanohalophilus levihalophilus TaxID=1431282 RepID=UPI001AE183AA|nr:4Fe-4S binding protein [Methanohalophilus levihalophilus]MBP2030493.1 polyferredoxin [Methanohalophilus levihalophilus]
MLKITPYLWIIVLIAAIGGLWYPILGYMMLVVMVTLLTTSVFRGRWFCGNLCPRGSLYDFVLGKFSRKQNIPKILSSLWIRVPAIVFMMSLMVNRLSIALTTQNTFEKVGTIFASMCLTTTIVATLMGGYFSSRTWCTVCPMGTMQRIIGGKKHQLKMVHDACVNCKKCEKICPMQLSVREIGNNPDCIKCNRCVEACPKDALYF